MKHTIILRIVSVILLALICTSCSNDADNTTSNAQYDMPDFSVPPTAVGTEPCITLSDIVNRVNNTKSFTFKFSDTLDKSTQTVYDNAELKGGEVVEKPVQPLGNTTNLFKMLPDDAVPHVEVSDFELYDSDKMAKLNKDKVPKTINESLVTTDICVDLTDASLIIRGVYAAKEDASNVTLFCTIRLTYSDDNQYTMSMRTEEYGNLNQKEYVYITDERFDFVTEDNDVQTGKYTCQSDTALIETTALVGAVDNTATALARRSERITLDIDIRQNDGKYDISRTMIMRQSQESSEPDDAQEIYRVEQTIQDKDGVYVLAEHAKGTDKNGDPVDSMKYVVFTTKAE